MNRERRKKVVAICRAAFRDGMTAKEISDALNLGRRSVEKYVQPEREVIGQKRPVKVM